MTAVGFEPMQLALVELESTPLDHSGKLSCVYAHAKVFSITANDAESSCASWRKHITRALCWSSTGQETQVSARAAGQRRAKRPRDRAAAGS